MSDEFELLHNLERLIAICHASRTGYTESRGSRGVCLKGRERRGKIKRYYGNALTKKSYKFITTCSRHVELTKATTPVLAGTTGP